MYEYEGGVYGSFFLGGLHCTGYGALAARFISGVGVGFL